MENDDDPIIKHKGEEYKFKLVADNPSKSGELKQEPESNSEGKKYAISERFIQDAKSYFEGSAFPYTYSREEAEEIYASAAQHGFDLAIGKLEEKEEDEIWKEIYIDFKDGEGWKSFQKRMKERFTITRKQSK